MELLSQKWRGQRENAKIAKNSYQNAIHLLPAKITIGYQKKHVLVLKIKELKQRKLLKNSEHCTK